jgi:16S rRNA (cytosine1407-C5)-methyltransferase
MDSNTLLPEAFINKMEKILPSHLKLADLIKYSHKPLRRAVRVNTLKISIAEFQQRSAQHEWLLTPIPWCAEGFWIEANNDLYSLGNSAEHQSGLCYIQEASSMMPVAALFHFFKASEKAILLDAAAAPGSKTTQMSAQMNNQGLIIGNEYSSSRIKMLHANIQRCGIKNVALTHFDAAVFGEWLPETFDAILLDAPCSGEGTVRKDKNAMKNWSQSAINDISSMQLTLIESAFNALKPGGILIYSTCTLSHEENQDVLHTLKSKHPTKVKYLSLENLCTESINRRWVPAYLATDIR